MTAVETIEKPKTAGPGNFTPSLKHLICSCQEKLETGGVARCGTKVGGPVMWLTPSKTAPMSICVVCYEMRYSHTPCQVCGRAA